MGTKPVQTDAYSNTKCLFHSEVWVPLTTNVHLIMVHPYYITAHGVGCNEELSQEVSLSGCKAPTKWVPMLSLSMEVTVSLTVLDCNIVQQLFIL